MKRTLAALLLATPAFGQDVVVEEEIVFDDTNRIFAGVFHAFYENLRFSITMIRIFLLTNKPLCI